MSWSPILIASLGCLALKQAGLVFPARWLQRPLLQRGTALVPVVLLSALIATETFSSGRVLSVDARAAGLGMAVLCVWRRLPFLVVVMAATLVTALLRLR